MSKADLNSWVRSLTQKNMPVLGSVITELNKIAGSDESDVNQLAEVILRDPNLTSHVLRVANSVQYNYGNQKINTVSRAIVLIGLKGMRAICISLLILDRLMSGAPKERVLRLIAQGFHGATQAANLLTVQGETETEEVFIAGLLYNLGEMSFWMSEDIDNDNLDLLAEDPKVRQEAMEKVLGTSFKAITRELAKHWKLGETLEHALFPSAQPNKKVRAVIAGERISRAALYGWDSPQMRKVVEEICLVTGMSVASALDMIQKNAAAATQIAVNYGVAEAGPMIPVSPLGREPKAVVPVSKILQPDAQLQLNILRELSTAARDKSDVNTIFQMVVEGMHRGVALERVAIAFINGHRLQAKYMLGEGTEHWRSSFNFDIGPYSDNIFTVTVERGGSCWFREEEMDSNRHLYPSEFVGIVGRLPCFTHLLSVGGRSAAMFYADRWTHGGKLDADQFESFKHFAHQAQTSLSGLSAKS